MKQSTRMQMLRQDKIFYAIVYTVIVLLTLSVLYPIIYILSSSFSSGEAVSSGKVLLFPVDFSLAGYRRVFEATATPFSTPWWAP